MNYRHAYHAGNFADVLKHIILTLLIEHQKKKEAPFRVIDTHAGIGFYDLTAIEPLKTNEWSGGIGRLFDKNLSFQNEVLLEPYLKVIKDENLQGDLKFYPGSPVIARRLLRPQDRLIVNELHPEDYAQLARRFPRDRHVKVLNLDGWIALKALLPPKEKRGIILIDPPFEKSGEFERMVVGLKEGLERFSTGTFFLWYPIKDLKARDLFHSAIATLRLKNIVVAEFYVGPILSDDQLHGAGYLIINPPFTLASQLQTLLPELCRLLSVDNMASFELDTHLPLKKAHSRYSSHF